MIVLINGFIGSGKDTVANILVEHCGFKKFSFASTLKDAVSHIFSWDRELIEGSTPESREWRETVDQWWASKLNIPHFTPRFALQHIGTDVLRTHFCDSIWILALERKLANYQGNIVITDGRYKNEISTLTAQGAQVWQVSRKNPDWYSYGVLAAEGNPAAIEHLKKLNIHQSEWDWLSAIPNHYIDNTGSLSDLEKTVISLI